MDSEQIMSERIIEDMEYKMDIVQHAIIRKRLYQTNLISVFDKVSDVLDKGNAVDLFYLHFIKIWDGTSWEIIS